jgi:hypothetical protein
MWYLPTVLKSWYLAGMKNYRFMPIPFSPSEVEAITGLTTTLQRDWRRRGLLEKRREIGQFGFNPEEVASIVVLQALRTLTDAKVETAAKHADRVALSVLRFALTDKRTWDFDGSPEEEARFNEEISRRDMFGQDYLNEMLELPQHDFGWFSVWHGGEWRVTDDVGGTFDMASDKEVGGIVLNHGVLGRQIADKITHPMFHAKLKSSKARQLG